VWGPAKVQSLGKKRYYVTFTDDYSRETTVVFLRKKSGVFGALTEHIARLVTQHNAKVKFIRSDRGGEYSSDELKKYLSKRGIHHEYTVHDSPEQNGVAERVNRTVVEHARALLIGADFPKALWAEAVNHAVYLKNRSPTRALTNKTPFEVVHGEKPDLSGIRRFGCTIYVKILDAGKLDERAKAGKFLGYDNESKGYRVLWPDTHRVSVERDVKFAPDEATTGDVQFEGENERIVLHNTSKPTSEASKTPATPTPSPVTTSQSTPPATVNHPSPTLPTTSLPEPEPAVEPRSTRRVQFPPGYYSRDVFDRAERINATWTEQSPDLEDEFPHDEFAMLAHYALASSPGDEPTIREALHGPDAEKWQKAMDDEIVAIEKLDTWDLVDPPADANIINSHFILKAKRDENGDITRYKARLVANGNSQREGIDYNETFAAVAKLPSVRAVLANAASQGWEIHQIDVKNAYLNAELTEDVYMRPPPGYLKPGQEGKVCKLKKSLYGLKQAGFEWYETLCEFFREIGFTRSAVDHAVFFKHDEKSSTVVSVSTDDMAATANSIEAIEWLKDELRKRFEISDLGEIKWLLGFEVKYDKTARTLSLSQRAYIDTLVDRFGLEHANTVSTPLEPGITLSIDQSPTTAQHTNEMQNVPYQELVGSLAWAALGSRPDIAFATSTLAQFTQNPGKTHWQAAKRVLRYLKGTRDLRLNLTDPNEGMLAYTDADWGSQPHRHSISGHVVSLAGMPVAWGSRKQNIVALSTTEAEYVAATNSLKDVIWLRSLISEIRAPIITPTIVMCDNQGAITLTQNNKFHPRTKHIDIRYHFIREAVNDGKVVLVYCPTSANVADIFTKALARSKVQKFVDMLGLC
jgi:hypothetical protein